MKPPRWQRRRDSPLTRKLDIFRCATQFGLAVAWDRATGKNTPRQVERRARWLVHELLELGPTFIKLGQALSTRSDLIPPTYAEALSNLQDQVPPFDANQAVAVIEAELGQSVEHLFTTFERQPIAAASLGQVHRATLPTGEDVVVKVQRPGLQTLLDLDFKVLQRIVPWLNRLLPKVQKYDLEPLYQEFFRLLYFEIDYIHEGQNAERFKTNFQRFREVMVPKVHWHYTATRVLTLEYLPGIKIDDVPTLKANQLDPDTIIEAGVSCYLKQILEDGFFQSDPHPGNMAVNPDGRLIFYDFGTMSEIQGLKQDEMVSTFFAVIERNSEGLLQSLIQMGLLEADGDNIVPLRRMVKFVLDRFREKPIDLRAFQEMSGEVYVLFEQEPFRLPSEMMFVVKAITTLDGIARSLNPNYNLLKASKPFIKSFTEGADKRNLLTKVAQQTTAFVRAKVNQPHPITTAVASLETRLEQGDFEFPTRSERSDRLLRRINLALKCLVYTGLFGILLLAGVGILIAGYLNWAIVFWCGSGFWLLLLGRNLFRLWVRERVEKLMQ
ncbi:MAG: AarF/ABC1/UbiB kinase family protein [Spirulina sp. SIO3F2]|nr:AarF/ABC1/UbiB kinase family protein [Spirulina sp. SIO3F2]